MGVGFEVSTKRGAESPHGGIRGRIDYGGRLVFVRLVCFPLLCLLIFLVRHVII